MKLRGYLLLPILALVSLAKSSCALLSGAGLARPAFVSSTLSSLGVSISTTWDDANGYGPANETTSSYYSPQLLQRRILPRTSTQLTQLTRSSEQTFKVYCDLDGVLTDFEHGIRQLFPDVQHHRSFQIQDLERSTMWRKVAQADAFFEKLPWTRDGRRLWQAIEHLQPDILTGVPNHPSSRMEKYRWCQRELGLRNAAHVDMAGWLHDHRCVNGGQKQRKGGNVITCWSSNKHHESGPGAVLIDDRQQLRDAWEAKGGIFIHHTGNVDDTIRQLREHGILSHS